MTKAEFEISFARHRKQILNDAMKTNIPTEAQANQYFEMDMNDILPDGFETKNHYWSTILNDESQEIGTLWHSFRGEGEKKTPYLGDIYIAPEFRRQGYGKKALELFESNLKAQGIKNNIGVHIVGDTNVAANQLCKSCGYSTFAIHMEKRMVPLP